ncbi:MAG TPA: hypothetical protein VF590_14070, partial [Isosphaeraceae bacterium]
MKPCRTSRLFAVPVALILIAVGIGSTAPARADAFVAGRTDGLVNEVHRYDEATGALIGHYASARGAETLHGLTAGPDGHLYGVGNTLGFGAVYRFDRSRGDADPWIPFDNFDNAYDDTVTAPVYLTFGPDGDLYTSSINWGFNTGPDSGQVLRYDGTTGAFRDVFVPTGSGGLEHPGPLAFRGG